MYGFLYFLQCFSQQRGPEDALQIARQFAMQKGCSESRLLLCSSDILKHRKSQGESFYIYKTDPSRRGFVIVSGITNLPDILAYSDYEDFTTEQIPESVKYWLSCYDDMAYHSAKSTQSAENPPKDVRPEGVSPLLGNIQWGQGSPYNQQCPVYNGSLCVTGCVATAMAMVMKYHQYPSCGTGRISYTTATRHIPVYRNLSDHPLLWESMNSRYDNSSTSVQKAAVANIMAGCGAAVKMDYSPDGSGAYQYDMLRAYVEYFGYDVDASFLLRDFYSTHTWHSLLIKELNEGRPVNYAGSNNSDGGHSFIIDGYQMSGNESYPYYHLNWGWSGRCDGYYYLSDLRPKENSEYYTSRTFSEGQQMLIGVKPDDNVQSNERTLSTDDVKVYPSSVKPGNRFSLTVSSIYNLSYLPFTGKVYVMLADKDSTIILGSKTVTNLEFLTGTNRMSIECHLPTSLMEGKYGIILTGSLDEQKLFHINTSDSIAISVGENADDNPTEQDATLCASEIEVFKQEEDESMIHLRVYEIFNYTEDTFTGIIQPVVKSRSNKILSLLPDTVILNEMLSRELFDTPVAFHFNVPESLENGTYKLFIGAIESSTNTYHDLMFYDCLSDEEPSEYYLDMIVFENEVRVGNHVFQKVPTAVRSITLSGKCEYTMFSMTGNRLSAPSKGINIVKKQDGTVVKIISRSL